MDYYDDGISFTSALRIIEEKQEEAQSKARKLVRTINLGLFLAFVFVVLVFVATMIDFGYYLIPILVLGFSALLVTLIVPSVFKKNLLRDVVNEEVINIFNYEKDTNYDYLGKVKMKNEFNKSMGLFTRFASVNTRYKITNNYNIDILNCTLFTSNGKSTNIHFDGIYIIFKISNGEIFQIRTKGKPQLKGVKFDRREVSIFLEFYPIDDSNSYINSNYVTLVESIVRKLNDSKKHVFLASNKEEVHLAYNPPKFMKYDKFTLQVLQEYYHYFSEILTIATEVEEALSDN